MKYDFGKGKWAQEDFKYIYGLAVTEYKTFFQGEDCIFNGECTSNGWGYDYVSMITKKKYKSGVKFSTKCDFLSYGAPLLVLTDDTFTDEKGILRYGLHFEVVAWEEGCNVWSVRPSHQADNPVEVALLAEPKFPVQGDSLIELTVEVEDKKLKITMNGEYFEVENPEIPDEFHVGITACEGLNRFYDLIIDE